MSKDTLLSLFAAFGAEKIAEIRQRMHLVDFPAGYWLMRKGEQGDRFYVIESGELEIIRVLEDGSERLIGLRRAGDFVGEGSLFDRDGLRSADVRARTDARLLEMKLSEFDTLLQSEPTLAYEVVGVVSRRLREADSATIRDLQTKNRELVQAYAELEAAQAQIIEKEKLERELQMARQIQESILPRRLPELRNLSLGARIEPARAVGGDFYDFIVLDEDHLGMVIGDVSDKGMPAAIFMAMVRSLIRAEAARSLLPAHVLQSVNRHLLDMNDAEMFVTVLYGVLQMSRGEFVYARAGHDMPLCYDRHRQAIALNFSQGLLLGIFPDPALDVQTVTLSPGSTLLLYTDGATDATDADGRLFGRERLIQVLEGSLGEPAQALCDRILEEIQAYHGATPQADDITLVALAVG